MGSEGVRVEDQLQVQHLQQLMYWFQSHKATRPISCTIKRTIKRTDFTPNSTKQIRTPGLLTLQELKLKLKTLLHPEAFDSQVETLLSRVKNCSYDLFI